MTDELRIRVHGDALLPTLVYLPGMHGDWTLVSSFRAAMAGRVRFVEFAYPRTLTWSLDDYARAIEQALLANGIERGWLLGESFGSQPAWAIIARDQISGEPAPSREENCRGVSEVRLPSPGGGVRKPHRSQPHFQTQGLILAGGFVRHPVNWAVRMAGLVSSATPLWFVKLFCVVYAWYARFRHKRAPETLASIAEFVANRTVEADRQAIVHRYALIADNDFRPVARQFGQPIYYLAGLVDPLVPWCYVRWWLRRNCPGYRGGKTVWRADHNVLGTAPQTAAGQILAWISETRLSQHDLELSIGRRQPG
ncbi:MAG: hypothetical protein DME21_06130 [Verrucomicrobia bacterium]|nr:MAG: hypothetical protein DME21_06130 [Verrucomicrobiota bacterium]